MNKSEFISYLRVNNYPTSIIETYYNEVNTSDHKWNINHFNMYLDHLAGMNGIFQNSILQSIVMDKIVPFYKNKFQVLSVIDKSGIILKIAD